MTQTYLAKDRFNHAIQALEPGITQNISFNAVSSTPSGADLNGDTVVIRLIPTVDCYVAVGLAATVTASTNSMLLPGLLPEYFRVDQGAGWRVAARGVAASGTLNITEMT